MLGPGYSYGVETCGFIGLFLGILIFGILFYVMKRKNHSAGNTISNIDIQILPVLKENSQKERLLQKNSTKPRKRSTNNYTSYFLHIYPL